MRIARRSASAKSRTKTGRLVAATCNFANAFPDRAPAAFARAVFGRRTSDALRDVRRSSRGIALRLAGAFALSIVVGGLLLEGMLRVGARGWTRAALAPWQEHRPWEAIRRPGPDGMPEPVPGGHAAWRIQPWHRPIEYRLDDHGFRAAAPPSIGGAPCRVLALGDSHTFGYGVGADDAWPAMLATMLARVTVANGGVAGSAVEGMEAWLPEALDAAHPHVVVLAVTPWSLRDDPEPAEQHELDPRWPRAESWLRRASSYSAVVDQVSRFAFQRTARAFGWPPPAPVLWELAPLVEPPSAFHARWRAMHTRLAHMVAEVRQRGATPIVLFVPLDVQVSAARNDLYRAGRLPYRTHGFVDRDYSRDDRYVHALDKTTARLRVTFVDSTEILRALAPGGYLPDDYHLAADGHAHVAALMAAPVAQACADAPTVLEVRAPPRAGHPAPM